MDAGKRNTKVTIEARTPGHDAAKQPLNTWFTVREPWASILVKNGAQTIKSDAPASVVQASFRIPWCTDVTAAMRVKVGSAIFQIQAVLPDMQRRRHIDLVCQMVAGRG